MTVENILAYAAAAVVCYLVGSINFSVIFSKHHFGRDVRESGSGNAGTTNMIRTFGWSAGLTVFAADAVKGCAGVLIGRAIFSFFGADPVAGEYLSAFFTCMGHIFPVFFGFRGGKGVATAIGAAMTIHPVPVFVLLVIGVALAAVSGFVSLGSVSAVGAFPVVVFFLFGLREFFLSLFIALPVLISHKDNIRRLIEHRENRFTPPSSDKKP